LSETPPRDRFDFDVLPPYRGFLRARSELREFKAALRAVSEFTERTFLYYDSRGDRVATGNAHSAESFVNYLAEAYDCPELVMLWEDWLMGEPSYRIRSRVLQPMDVRFRHGGRIWEIRGMQEETEEERTAALLRATETQRALYVDRHKMYADELIKKVVFFWGWWLDEVAEGQGRT